MIAVRQVILANLEVQLVEQLISELANIDRFLNPVEEIMDDDLETLVVKTKYFVLQTI